MEICKFQTDATGTRVLVYNRSRVLFAEIAAPEMVATIRAALALGPIEKVYAKAQIDAAGKIHIGETVGAQDW